MLTAFHRRRLASLLGIWTALLSLAALLYWVQSTLPALVDIMTPMYIIIGVALIVMTVRWLRDRSYHDRRHSDRRHEERRDELSDEPPDDH